MGQPVHRLAARDDPDVQRGRIETNLLHRRAVGLSDHRPARLTDQRRNLKLRDPFRAVGDLALSDPNALQDRLVRLDLDRTHRRGELLRVLLMACAQSGPGMRGAPARLTATRRPLDRRRSAQVSHRLLPPVRSLGCFQHVRNHSSPQTAHPVSLTRPGRTAAARVLMPLVAALGGPVDVPEIPAAREPAAPRARLSVRRDPAAAPSAVGGSGRHRRRERRPPLLMR